MVPPPAVSVVIPCYRQAEYLRLAIDSVALQRFSDWELVVVDDGSPDDTAEVAEAQFSRLPGRRLRLIRQENAGLAAARNAGIAATRGRYVLPLDSDDALDPEYLSRTVALLEARPEVAIAVTDAALFGVEQGVWRTEPELPLHRLLTQNRFTYCALYRREVWEAVGGYEPNLTAGYEDWDFWIGALERGFKAAHVPEPLFLYRTKGESMLTKAREWDRSLRARILLNHPGLFDEASREEAARSLAQRPLPAPKAGSDRHRPAAAPAARPAAPTPGAVAAAPVRQRPRRAAPDRLRILHTVEFYWPHVGGSEVVVQQVSERLARRGHDVTVATSHDRERPPGPVNGVRVEAFRLSGSLVNGLEGPDAARYTSFVDGFDGDVMLNYGVANWATDTAFARVLRPRGALASVLAPVNYGDLQDDLVTCTHGFGAYYEKVLPLVLPRYDALLHHVPGGRDERLARRLGLSHDVVVQNGVPAEEFDAPPALDFRAAHGITTRFVVLCVANFFPSKGHRHVIEAVRRLGRPDVTLVLIGREGAALAASRAAAAALPQARILTTATRQETVAAFHAADAFLFGSELECAPLVLLEAMASRTPFVSTDVGNARLLPGGVIAPVDSLAQALGAVLDDAARREVLAEAGHRAWREAYTWEGVVDRYERLYLALARGETATEFRDAAAGVSSPR